MTMTVPPRTGPPAAPVRETPTVAPTPRRALPADAPGPALGRRRAVMLAIVWTGVGLASIGLVLYALTPSFAQREQRRLLDAYRVELQQSANESLTIEGATAPTRAPELGAPIGVLEIGGIQVQQVTVEGVSPSQTAAGLGHVPGTAGLGEPGNAVVVGRRALFGGPLGDVAALHPGDRILVTTTQGQSIYKVERVGDHRIDDATAVTAKNDDLYGSGTPEADPLSAETVHADDLYGASKDDRLTLVTSASAIPLNRAYATIVVAKLEGRPFPPTPQNGRTDSQNGRGADGTAWAPLVLALLFYAAAALSAVLLYRRSSPRVAYLLTVAPLLVATIVIAETVARLLPAWT